MAGWFDGLFQGAAEVENRRSSDDRNTGFAGTNRSAYRLRCRFPSGRRGREGRGVDSDVHRLRRRESPRSPTRFQSRDPRT